MREPRATYRLQLHAGLCIPAVFLALQVEIEKALLQFTTVVGVEVRPVLEPVRFQPFLLRRRADEAYVSNRRSRAVMERLGMRRDPADDFDHPNLPLRQRKGLAFTADGSGVARSGGNAALDSETSAASRRFCTSSLPTASVLSALITSHPLAGNADSPG